MNRDSGEIPGGAGPDSTSFHIRDADERDLSVIAAIFNREIGRRLLGYGVEAQESRVGIVLTGDLSRNHAVSRLGQAPLGDRPGQRCAWCRCLRNDCLFLLAALAIVPLALRGLGGRRGECHDEPS